MQFDEGFPQPREAVGELRCFGQFGRKASGGLGDLFEMCAERDAVLVRFGKPEVVLRVLGQDALDGSKKSPTSPIAALICSRTQGNSLKTSVAVSAEKQGKGIGSALMAFAEDEIRRAEGRLIIIETSSKPEYQKTRRFYLSRGYRIDGCLSDFYAPGDDKLTHQKRLS